MTREEKIIAERTKWLERLQCETKCEACRLYFHEDFTIGEIATILGYSESDVREWVSEE